MALDADLRELAEEQHGLVSVAQARGLGRSRSALLHRRTGADWEMATPRVMRLVGAPRTDRQDLMAAVLDGGPGTVASHRSAAALWGLPGFAFGRPETARQHGRSSRAPSVGRLHRPRRLPPPHVTEHSGIPVTTVARTLFDLADDIPRARLERVLDTVLGRNPAMLPVLHAMLGEIGRRGRDGVASVRPLLAARPAGYRAPASGLEARFARIIAESGQPPLDRQVDVGGHGWVGRVDFVDRPVGLIVEVDGETHHTSLLDRRHDRRRDEALLSAGWRQVLRVTGDQVWQHPAEVAALVRTARVELRRSAAS